jgi:hypothetical protein
LTVTLPGFEAMLVSNRPPDIVPSRAPVEVTYTFNVAVEFELVASTRRRPAFHSARVIMTVSVAGEGAELTVSTALRLAPPVAVIVAVPAPDVETLNEALVAPAGTVTDAGTVATALELESDTASPPVGAAAERVTVPVELAPEVTVDGLSVSAVRLGPVATGSRVSVADNVTPPPDTEIVTSVLVLTGEVPMLNPPAPANWGTVTELGMVTRSGREVESEKVTSASLGSAAVTRPNEPDELEVVAGSSVMEVGAGCGVSVVVACTLAPRQVAVIVTGVSEETRLVGIVNETDSTPAGTVTLAGGWAAGLELERLTTAPPACACPFSITIAPSGTPPFWRTGMPSRLRSDDGLTVKLFVVETEPIVAVIVTVAGVSTWPVTKRNVAKEKPAGTATEAGSGAACAFELVRLIVAPPAGAPLFSWRST